MNTTVNDYRVRIVDEKNRINELIQECRYDIMGIPHLDMNQFVDLFLHEVLDKLQEAEDSGLPPYHYVMKHFGIQ